MLNDEIRKKREELNRSIEESKNYSHMCKLLRNIAQIKLVV